MKHQSSAEAREGRSQDNVQPILAFVDADIVSGKDEIAREEFA